nr:immunoglobulin light chain junction region [Macaca mulatta]
CQHYNNWISF